MRTHAPEARRPEGAPRRGRRALPLVVEEELRRHGRPLDPDVRAEMEGLLGHDLGDVRIHAGPGAAEAAGALGAAAFTAGSHIVLGAGRYRPETAEGRRLLAHELTHTVQHAPKLPGVGEAGTADRGGPARLEQEADAVAARAAAGEPVPAGLVTAAAPVAHDRVALKPVAELAPVPAEVPEGPDALFEVAAEVQRALTFDSDDAFGRARRRMTELAPATREGVLARLAPRLPDAQRALLAAIVADLAPERTDPRAALAAAEAVAEDHGVRFREPARGRAVAPGGELATDAGGTEAPAPAEAEAGVPGDADAVARGEGGTLVRRADEAAVPGEREPEEAEPDEREGEPELPEAPEEIADAPVEVPELEAADEAKPAEPEAEAGAAAAEPEPAERERAAAAAPEGARREVGDVAPEDAEEDAADAAPAEEVESDALASVEEAEEEAEDAAIEDAPAPEDVAAGPPAPSGAAAAEEPDEADEEGGPEPASTEPPQPAPEDPADEEGEEDEGAEADEFVDDALPSPGEEAAEAAELGGGQAEPDTGAEGDPATLEAEEAEPAEDGPDTDDAPADPGAIDQAEEAEADAETGGGDEDEGTPIEAPAEEDAPDVPADDPDAALATVSRLSPAAQQRALGGVSAAATGSVDRRHEAIAASPPALDRPSGAPSAAERAAEAAEPPPAAGLPKLERVPEPGTPAPVRPAPLPPQSAPATQRVAAPRLPEGPNGDLSEQGRKELQASLRALPVQDAGLRLKAGPAPGLELEEGADPARAEAQRAELERATHAARVDGHREVVRPMGETELFPEVPPERLRAALPARASRAAPPAEREAAAPAEGADSQERAESIVAMQERGAELRGAAAGARQEMAAERAGHEEKLAEERRQADADVNEIVRQNADEQTAERRKARADVHAERVAWSGEQRALAESTRKDAGEVTSNVAREVAERRTAAEKEAATHIEQGDREAEEARVAGEKKAAEERAKGEQEADKGLLGWLADKATELFDSVKQAIADAFEAARAAVRNAIKRAQELAASVIDRAREAIVGAIKLAGAALVALGDKLLAGFPALRDRFRKAIEERVAKAEALVNALADRLKADVQRALDLLGAALDAVLGLLEKALLAVVDAYRAAVEGALKFARAALEAFAAFAALVEDISADPLQWIVNLGRGAKAGVRKHLWTAFKKAIKRWFSEKVEEVLGLGLTIWNVLKKGGISLAKIGAMAWAAIKAAIPPTLIQILIEKLISLIIPAAGAIMLIIEGLQAAWGTIKRIIEAFQRFFVFLKAVRSGRSGRKFAEALAAAAIALIDFVANWLLKRLRKPAGKIAKKIRELAKKLGRKLGKAAKGLGKKLKPRRGGKPKRKKQTPDKRAKAQRRVDKATEFLARQLVRGMPFPVLRAQMIYASAVYRVRIRLRDRQKGASLMIEANPKRTVLLSDGREVDQSDYPARLRDLVGELLKWHERHHMLAQGKGTAKWWEALEIDWHHERNFLYLPPFLHQKGVHKRYRAIRTMTATARKLYGDYEENWDRHLLLWIGATLKAEGLTSVAKVRAASDSVRRRLRRAVAAELTAMISIFSRRVEYDLNLFRTDTAMKRFKERYKKPLEKIQDELAKAARKAKGGRLGTRHARRIVDKHMKPALKGAQLKGKAARIRTRAVKIYKLLRKK
jgi:hypothetical protein